MANPAQPLRNTLIVEGLKIRKDVMVDYHLATVAKQFTAEIFIAGDGVAINAKSFALFDNVRIYDPGFVTVGARGLDAVAAADAVAAFLSSARTED